jgi:glycosyltransferase involved in cell wall biosynthesis
MAGPMTWELAEDLAKELGCAALLTGHPDTLAKTAPGVILQAAPAYERGSFARRAFSWLRYLWSAFFWLWRWPKDTPLLLFSNPPLLCWLGWLMRGLRGQKYAEMVHDIYPDVLVRLQGISEKHPLIRAWRWLNRRAYNRAQVVMTLGEYMAENLARQFDPARTPAGKVEIVYPWVDTERIKPIPKEENWFAQKYGQVGKLTVMYSGNMGLGHDIETMVEAARLLKDEPDIHFMFIGAGPKWSKVFDMLNTDGLRNVTLLPWQSEENLSYSLTTGDISIVSIETGAGGLMIPSKAIYSLASGSYIVTISDKNNDLSLWISRFRFGVVIPNQNAFEIVNAIKKFRHSQKNFSSVCAALFDRFFNFKKLNNILAKYLFIGIAS